MDRSTTQLTSNKHSKKLKDLNEMSINISSKLQNDTRKLEDSYFRNGEINKELGFSSSLLSDIGRAKKKQRLIWFFILLLMIILVFFFPFFRIRVFNMWHSKNFPGPLKPPENQDDSPPDQNQKGPIN